MSPDSNINPAAGRPAAGYSRSMPTIAQIETPAGCPIGPITAGVTDAGVCLLTLRPVAAATEQLDALAGHFPDPIEHGDHPLLNRLRTELDAYFTGRSAIFEVPLDTPGTDWERRVWDALRGIPAGETRSYAQIARSLDNPGGSRAVGLANGRNRVAILIPCHRVIASDGSLHGYAGGLDRKQWLLQHEQARGSDSGSLFEPCQDTAF